ncbi:uncharacterized protein LOC129773067 [Toxorhynchites rutilus septentrionalis]|uniref:uncharacterized protein LOC129773067 n=1 Tax=Toxorhynchites rutilus septentrionalis TaxID=329112 RepID=UPI00247A5A1E|nr:uncharacterized protein LOC129773067 [Toxorhynchites rutilus septentrionalis]
MISLQDLAGTILPVLAILFVGTIAFVNLFYRVRKLFPVKVNCWFCNTNTKVPYDDGNSWVCPSCTQYNGFTEDGDYNREIPAQYQRKLNPGANITDDDKISYSAPQNGLCFGCNRNQELKIHQLASFVPEVEENYDEEVEEYERQLEISYKLCSRCERVVKRTLNDVKRNILGSKLAQIGTKGLKVFDLHMQTSDKQSAFRKRKMVTDVCLWTVIAMLAIKIGQKAMEFEFSKDRLELIFSPIVSQTILVVISYAVSLKRTLFARWGGIIEQPLIVNGVNQLKTVRKLVFGKLDEKLNISAESICEALHEPPVIMAQRNSLPNLALICLAAMLMAMKSHIRSWKPIALIACCGAEMLLKSDIGPEVFGSKIHSALIEVMLSSVAFVTAISCIGHTGPKIQPSDNLSSSFHKIYSNQGNECDNDEQLESSSLLQQDASTCSQKAFGNNESAKSIDTTRSISPSALTASTLRPFVDSSFIRTSPNKSHFGGSVLNVNRLNTTMQENSFCEISHHGPFRAEHSLLKTPSISVDNFTTAISAASERRFHKNGFSMNAIDDPTLQGDEHFGEHIDRLSIGGRMSVSRKDLSVMNNPFANHHVEHDESFSLRQRKVTHSPPHLDTVAESGGSWIAGGYWSPQKTSDAETEYHGHPFMSRTSSQSSGFESQPTRRPTPEDPAGIDLDQVSLFSEPVGIFPPHNGSTFPQPNPSLNQTLGYPLSQSSPTPSNGSFFSRHSTNASRNLFGERSLFQTNPSSRMFPPHSRSAYPSGMAPSQHGFFSSRSNNNVFPPQQSQTPVFGSTSNMCQSNLPSFHQQGHRRPAYPTPVNNHRRSLLNLSKLSEVPEGSVQLAEKLTEA